MRFAKATLESQSPYSQGKCYEVPKLERETHDEYERRTWRERCHVNAQGNIIIPGNSIKNALAEAAKFTPRKGPSGGKSTWTKNFESGVMVADSITLPEKKETVEGERLYVPSDGRRGGSKRVWKTFPLVKEWKGTIEFLIIDDSINEKIFKQYLEEAGMYIGLGRWRPRNNGLYGRFSVAKLEYGERE
jgi:hypothetical protein